MHKQRGYSFITFILGLIVGLILAAGVALYINKAPLPFVDRFSQQAPPQVPANWNPNQALQPSATAPATATPTPVPPSGNGTSPNIAPEDDPIAIAALGGALPPGGEHPAASTSVTPEGSAANPVANMDTKFYVQAGAFSSSAEAEQQRARLALIGSQATISQGTAAGRTLHRVRLGPYATREAASIAQKNMAANGVEASIVSVQP